MRTHVRRPDALEHGGRTRQVRSPPQTALLQLQRQAGNRAASALVGVPGSGTPIPSAQRLHVQRNENNPVVENATQEAAKQVAVPATLATVPAPATAADATRMALILQAEGPGHGLAATEIVEAQRGLPEVVEEYNASRSELADMDESERAAVFGVADTTGQEAEPDLSAVGKVLDVPSPSPNGEPGAQPLGPASDSPDQIEAAIEQTEPDVTRAARFLSLDARLLGVEPKVHDSDSKMAALLSQSDAKLAAAQDTVQQVVNAEGARTSTAPAVASRPRAGRISGSASPPAPVPAQRAKEPGRFKRFFTRITSKKARKKATKAVDVSSGAAANMLGVAHKVEPATQGAEESPLSVEGTHQDAQPVFGGMGHALNALGLLGGLTPIVLAIKDFRAAWKQKKEEGKGRLQRFTSKNCRQALAKMGDGAVKIGKSILNILKGSVDKARAAVDKLPLLGPMAAAIGAVASFVASGLAFRQSWRARRRRKAARKWEDFLNPIKEKMQKAKDEKNPTTAQSEHGEFMAGFLAAVRALRIKATRKKRRRFGGGIIAGLSGAGGIFTLMGLVGAVGLANIWNPVGWAIAGAAAVAGLALGIYKLVRFIKRKASRKKAGERTKEKGGAETKETKETHADFVHTEINCAKKKGHVNSAVHEDTMRKFVDEVLRKDPEKVKEKEPSYIKGKWSSW